jgi:hypothetical protein
VAAVVKEPGSLPKWPSEPGPFTTQAQLDQCAEELWTGLDPTGAARHIPSSMDRGWDNTGDFRRLRVTTGAAVVIEFGTMAVLVNGAVQVFTPDGFTAAGYSE